MRALLLAVSLAAPARAQVDFGTGLSPDAFTGRSRKDDTVRATPLAAALSLSASATEWASVGLSTAATPAEGLAALVDKGFYKREVLELFLIARGSGRPLAELAGRREKGERPRAIAEGLGVPFDPVYERALALERDVDARMRELARVAPVPDPSAAAAAPKAARRDLPGFPKSAAMTFPSGKTIAVELAASPAERERGLMFRRRLPPDYGMLFVFPREQALSFWMKNTFVDLDMLFIDSDKRVTVVHADVPRSREDTPDREVAVRSGRGRYVLELAAGTARALGLSAGDRLAFDAPQAAR